ncbi:MAG: hypothetical protein K2O23_05040, partial [Anaeroplasmataceae bacterium]|nr:hypothetical protein [Anaeroplasmataceae bacterium]
MSNRNDFTIGTMLKDNSYGYERIYRRNDRIVGIYEEQATCEDKQDLIEIYTGICCIKTSLFLEVLHQFKDQHLKDNFITHILSFADKIKIETVKIEDSNLYRIPDLYSLSCVEEELRNKINKRHMLNGVCIMNPFSTTIAKDVKIDEGTIIYPGCNIFGKTSIGKNCIIGPNTDLKNATLDDEVSCVYSVVNDSTISKNAYVGPFAHIRSNSVIGIGDRIGNFVEIKNSTLGTRTDVAHLTYIGDTCCGDYVNWGCGCVTVNYDGQNKNKTIVGNHCFIGCNTNLIAPIVIGDHSFIAAGSTIDTNVEAGDFAIARARQINKKDYAKKY